MMIYNNNIYFTIYIYIKYNNFIIIFYHCLMNHHITYLATYIR